MLTEQAIARIRAYAKDRKLRPATLARIANLSPNALRGFNEKNWNPKATTIMKLEAAIPADFAQDAAE